MEGTGTLFGPFVEALGSTLDTLVIPYPVDQTLGYAELEAFVRARLPEGRRFAILGESFSGPVAIRIAADPPPGLVGLLLCVTFAQSPSPALRWVSALGPWLPMKSAPQWMLGHALWGEYSAPGIPERVMAALESVDSDVLRHRLGAMGTVDEAEALARVLVPILVLQATDDRLVPPHCAETMLRLQPRARRQVVVGPHLLLQVKPAECALRVRGFLGAL